MALFSIFLNFLSIPFDLSKFFLVSHMKELPHRDLLGHQDPYQGENKQKFTKDQFLYMKSYVFRFTPLVLKNVE
jgi:hypothetical protein